MNRRTNRMRCKGTIGLIVTVIVIMQCIMTSCAPDGRSTGSFKTLPAGEGWNRSLPLVFEPEYNDSNATYDIVVAIRHTNTFQYSNMPLMVDLLGDSARLTSRVPIEIDVADEFGNWHGTGFGTMFQCKTVVAKALKPEQARKVIVWQAMSDTTTVQGITEVGVLVNIH